MSAEYRPPTSGGASTIARNSWARASSASGVPGSVMATKSSAGAISPIAAWKAFGSVVVPDFELTQKSVRCSRGPRPEAAHRVGVRRVEDPQLEAVGRRGAAAALAAGPAEDAAEQLRRQARAAHAEHRRATVPVLADVAARGARARRRARAIASGRSSQPSQRGDLLGRLAGGRPQRSVLRPEPLGDALRRPRLEPRPRSRRRGRSCRGELLALRLDRLDQLVEALREAGDALGDELVGDPLHR